MQLFVRPASQTSLVWISTQSFLPICLASDGLARRVAHAVTSTTDQLARSLVLANPDSGRSCLTSLLILLQPRLRCVTRTCVDSSILAWHKLGYWESMFWAEKMITCRSACSVKRNPFHWRGAIAMHGRRYNYHRKCNIVQWCMRSAQEPNGPARA